MADKDLQEYSAAWWVGEIDRTAKELDQKWRTGADQVVKRYLDERDDAQMDTAGERKYNIFWANTQIMKSALYATPPKPTVTRQNGDADDDVARVAALMLERILEIGITKDESDMHGGITAAVEDRLIPGMGQIWLRYDAETEKYKTEDIKDEVTGEVLEAGTDAERIVRENCYTEHVYWKDFVWQAARNWSEVGWIARRVWMKKRTFLSRFGETAKSRWAEIKDAAKASTGIDSNYQELPKGFRTGKAEVWEIWCRDSNKVYWVNRHLDAVLDEKTDPLQLEGFYPCPEPLLATHTTNSLIPRPDYVMVQDQYAELDILNNRIAALTRALRVVGAYDKNNAELSRMITGSELNMVPVENWAMLSEKGGMAKAVDWFPVDVVAGVLEKLVQQRILTIQQIYELTSISDIMRGGSNPRETLGAQKLKAQYSSVRLQLTQKDVATFVRRAMLIKAEIVAKHYQPATILDQSQIEQTESGKDKALVANAIMLLQDWKENRYRIEISEESLSIADYTAEREMRTEVLSAIGQFFSQIAPIAEAQPQMTKPLLALTKWVLASFRGSADIETVMDAAIASVNPNPPQEGGEPPEDKGPEMQAKIAIEQIKADSKARSDDLHAQLQMALAEMNQNTQTMIAEMNNNIKVMVEEMKQAGNQQAAALQAQQDSARMAHEAAQGDAQRAHDAAALDAQQAHASQQTAAEQEHAASMANEDRAFSEAQSSEDRKLQQGLAKTKAANQTKK